MEKDWIVETEGLCYSYEGGTQKALDHVDLRLRRGSRTAFMGGNGSGKSTLFLCLNGIRRPDSGEIRIGGKPIEYTRRGLMDVRRRVGVVFQEPDNHLFSASVYQEISFGILNLGTEEEQARREVEQVIRELGIMSFQDRPAHALSGGEKKLVAIADILVMHPEVMILDEPASSLDPKHRKKVREITEGLTEKGITVLMATHDVDYAYSWADEIILMQEGRVIRQGTPLQVFSDRGALEAAGLEMPAVLRIWENMKKRERILSEEAPPRNLEELEQFLCTGTVS